MFSPLLYFQTCFSNLHLIITVPDAQSTTHCVSAAINLLGSLTWQSVWLSPALNKSLIYFTWPRRLCLKGRLGSSAVLPVHVCLFVLVNFIPLKDREKWCALCPTYRNSNCVDHCWEVLKQWNIRQEISRPERWCRWPAARIRVLCDEVTSRFWSISVWLGRCRSSFQPLLHP